MQNSIFRVGFLFSLWVLTWNGKWWKTASTSTHLSVETLLRMLRWYVWPVLLYACETSTLKINIMNRLEAFELWWMLRVPWTFHTTNAEVLRIRAPIVSFCRRVKEENFLNSVMKFLVQIWITEVTNPWKSRGDAIDRPQETIMSI